MNFVFIVVNHVGVSQPTGIRKSPICVEIVCMQSCLHTSRMIKTGQSSFSHVVMRKYKMLQKCVYFERR